MLHKGNRLWCAFAALTTAALAASEDPEFLSSIVADLDKLQRVTDVPHPMADSTVVFCRIAYNESQHGDWEYAVLDGPSKRVLARGRIDSCIECHQQYASTDYVTRAYMKSK